MSDNIQSKQVVSVSEMASLVGLSRQRFHALINRAFPPPVYDIRTRRPIYPAELIAQCLAVRQTGIGHDGRPVLFYRKTQHSLGQRKRVPARPQEPPMDDSVLDILEGIRALGMTSATSAEVGAAVKSLFPAGVGDKDLGEPIRAVFVHLTRNHGNIVGR